MAGRRHPPPSRNNHEVPPRVRPPPAACLRLAAPRGGRRAGRELRAGDDAGHGADGLPHVLLAGHERLRRRDGAHRRRPEHVVHAAGRHDDDVQHQVERRGEHADEDVGTRSSAHRANDRLPFSERGDGARHRIDSNDVRFGRHPRHARYRALPSRMLEVGVHDRAFADAQRRLRHDAEVEGVSNLRRWRINLLGCVRRSRCIADAWRRRTIGSTSGRSR